MNLEDELGDVVGKARRGRGMSRDDVAELAGLDAAEIAAIEAYESTPSANAVLRLARALGLRPEALQASARSEYAPVVPDLADWGCIEHIVSRYRGMAVNAWLLWDPDTSLALLVDTGTDFEQISRSVRSRGLQLRFLGLTHTHSDHIAELDRVRSEFDPEVLSSPAEPVPRSRPVRHGEKVALGSLEIEVIETDGHSPGGLTFYATGFQGAAGVAAVGDALFAGSAGGAGVSYELLMRNIHTRILALPDNTLLLPGHGPMTTVAQERAFNPFAPLDG